MQESNQFDWQLFSVLQCNVSAKEVCMSHVRLLQILREILVRIDKTAIGDDDAFMEASYKRVSPFEDNDSEEELFVRRMGMRDYLRMLRTSRVKIRDSVENKKRAAE